MTETLPPSAEQLFLLLSAGFAAAILVQHLFAWSARVGARVHLWAWVWGAGSLAWCLSRALIVSLGPSRPGAAALWSVLGLAALVPLAVGTVGVLGTARRDLLPQRFVAAVLAAGLGLVVVFVLLGGVDPARVRLQPGLGADFVVVEPGPVVLGGALVAVPALVFGLLRLVLRQGFDRYVRVLLFVGVLAWAGTLLNDLLLAADLVRSLPVHSHGLLVLGIVLTAALSAEDRVRSDEVGDLVAAHRRSVEEQNRLLVQALASSRQANEVRQRFLARVSHELRTPLHGILGMTELAMDGVSEPVRRYLDSAHRSAEELLQLVDDILDLSRAEAGRLSLASRSFALHDFLEDTLQIVGPQAAAKDLEVRLQASEDLPGSVVGDPLRLRQVLLNLLGNAVKFTERGEVVLAVHPAEAAVGERALRFEVRDTGPGIPQDEQKSILEPFAQGALGLGRGTGLGLAISAELVRRMGGELEVRSEMGRGSTFAFTLGFEAPDFPEEVSLVDPILLQGVRVLIVEAQAGAAAAMDAELSSWRMYTRRIEGSDGALPELDRARSEGRPYALALLDLDARGGSDWELLRAIGRLPAPRPAVLFVLPQGAASTDYERARGLGALAVLARPVRPAELLEGVLLAAGSSGRAGAEPGALPAGPVDGVRILVADDRQINRELARALLEALGCHVDTVEDGEGAIRAVREASYELVLMDVSMPGMDGDEATRRIRAEEQATGRPRVPVVALTAHTLPEVQARLRAAGVDEVMPKPLKRAALEQLVARYRGGSSGLPPDGRPSEDWGSDLSSSTGRRTPRPLLDPDRTEETPMAPRPSNPALPEVTASQAEGALDLARLDAIVGGDEELKVELLRLFLAELPGYEDRLGAAVAKGELGAIARSAHALKGASSNVAAVDLYQGAALLESAARHGDLPAAQTAWSEVAWELRRVRPALRAVVGEGSA